MLRPSCSFRQGRLPSRSSMCSWHRPKLEEMLKLPQMPVDDVVHGFVVVAASGDVTIVDKDADKLFASFVTKVTKNAVS